MGKHKEKSKKSKKLKNKHKKRSRSSDSNSSGGEIVWTENNFDKNISNVPDKPKNKFDDKASNIEKNKTDVSDKEETNEIAEEDNWLGLITKSSKSSTKQSLLNRDIRKQESVKEDNKLRYARELNSYFRDDVNKKFIDEPEDYWKQKSKSKIEEVESSDEESESSDSEKVSKIETTPVVRKMTDAERNTINSKIIKAELMGDDDLVNELKEKLRKIDESGGVDDLKESKVEYYANKSSKSKQDAAEDKMNVKEMYLQSKTQISSRDEAMRFVASSSKIRSTDDEYEGSQKKKNKKVRLDTVGYQRIQTSGADDANCNDCIEKIGKHLALKFIPQLKHCFVCFTPYQPFTSNYCQIRSRSHSSNCTIKCDEECWSEIRQVMRLLASFFDQYFGHSVVFMETYFMYQRKSQSISRKHFVIECVPIKKRLEADARIFFHKAIMECEEEWSMNKKLIKLDGKSVTKMIPNGLPYFWVSFGPNFNGFAHVIEDEDYFRKDFGKEIIGGLRDIEPVKWLKPRFENYDSQLKRMVEVKNKWNNFIDDSNNDDGR